MSASVRRPGVGPLQGQAHAVFLLQQPIDDRLIGSETCVALMGGRDRETATVDVVHDNVDDLETGRLQDLRHNSEGIIFDMLVANRVIGVEAKHGRHVALFEMPDAVFGKDLGHLTSKGDGILKIIKHRNGCHDLGPLL